MTPTAQRFPSRRRILLGLGLLTQIAAAPKPQIVTVLGDSITAGLGLPARDAMPAQLQAALGKLGASAVVRAAGVSGDTSGGGLARVGFSVAADTKVCVVALGGNDLLQGVEPVQTKANLRGILQKLKAAASAWCWSGSARRPASERPTLASSTRSIPASRRNLGFRSTPTSWPAVGGAPTLMQRDGIHPNAVGAKRIGEALAPDRRQGSQGSVKPGPPRH
jgi:acyl-CoA thioesterase-1